MSNFNGEMLKLSYCAIFLAASLAPAVAREFYVDPAAGQEQAAGSAQEPVKSPAALVGTLQPGDIVYLGGGEYTEPVTFTDSGTAELAHSPLNSKARPVL